MKNSKVYDRPIKPFPEYVQKDITYKLHTLLLALLRPTITPSILQPNILNLSEEDWTRLFTLAAQHGVTALLFDTISPAPGTATALQSPQNPLGPEFGSHREAPCPTDPCRTRTDNALRFARRPYDPFERAGPQHLLPPAGAPRMRRHRSVARRLRQGQPFDRRAGD